MENTQGSGGDHKNSGKSEIITDNDKNHIQWRAKNGKDFAKVFYKNMKQCPKTHDGKMICMNFSYVAFATNLAAEYTNLPLKTRKPLETLSLPAAKEHPNRIFNLGQRKQGFSSSVPEKLIPLFETTQGCSI
jgi:hypothetical protein